MNDPWTLVALGWLLGLTTATVVVIVWGLKIKCW